MKLSVLSIVAVFATGASGFMPKTTGKQSVLASEAIQVFKQTYPDRPPVTVPAWRQFGMPNRDIDGTTYNVVKPGQALKRLSDISEKEALASFAELAKLYGEEETLGMVKAMPIILAFSKKEFAGCRKAWSEIFGDEACKAMVIRNPGLLACRAIDAPNTNEQTMAFSYIVALTRPAGPFLLSTTLALLLTPALEALTGLSIRTSVLSTLTGADSCGSC
jgi:hypothetical protein